jgi:hypothetical protein
MELLIFCYAAALVIWGLSKIKHDDLEPIL